MYDDIIPMHPQLAKSRLTIDRYEIEAGTGRLHDGFLEFEDFFLSVQHIVIVVQQDKNFGERRTTSDQCPAFLFDRV